jgi:hypothetical protein
MSYINQPDHSRMKTIVAESSHPASIEEETNPATETIPPARKRAGLESEIEAAERYFKAFREIEFLTFII